MEESPDSQHQGNKNKTTPEGRPHLQPIEGMVRCASSVQDSHLELVTYLRGYYLLIIYLHMYFYIHIHMVILSSTNIQT